jgi:hypothetical protein
MKTISILVLMGYLPLGLTVETNALRKAIMASQRKAIAQLPTKYVRAHHKSVYQTSRSFLHFALIRVDSMLQKSLAVTADSVFYAISVNSTGGDVEAIISTGGKDAYYIYDQDDRARIKIKDTGDLPFNLRQVLNTPSICPDSFVQDIVPFSGYTHGNYISCTKWYNRKYNKKAQSWCFYL